MSRVQKKAESSGKKGSGNVSVGIKLALREITKELKKQSGSSNSVDKHDDKLELKKQI